jgi:hypothetical protein
MAAETQPNSQKLLWRIRATMHEISEALGTRPRARQQPDALGGLGLATLSKDCGWEPLE